MKSAVLEMPADRQSDSIDKVLSYTDIRTHVTQNYAIPHRVTWRDRDGDKVTVDPMIRILAYLRNQKKLKSLDELDGLFPEELPIPMTYGGNELWHFYRRGIDY